MKREIDTYEDMDGDAEWTGCQQAVGLAGIAFGALMLALAWVARVRHWKNRRDTWNR